MHVRMRGPSMAGGDDLLAGSFTSKRNVIRMDCGGKNQREERIFTHWKIGKKFAHFFPRTRENIKGICTLDEFMSSDAL
jgi:hypothetical protein